MPCGHQTWQRVGQAYRGHGIEDAHEVGPQRNAAHPNTTIFGFTNLRQPIGTGPRCGRPTGKAEQRQIDLGHLLLLALHHAGQPLLPVVEDHASVRPFKTKG